MDAENYLPFLAAPGGKTHAVALAIVAEREAATEARQRYIREHKLAGLWASESSVNGIIIREDETVPEGWKVKTRLEKGVVLVPDGRKRALAKQLREAISRIPGLPGAHDFSKRLDFGGYVNAMAWRVAYFSKLGDAVVVFVPKLPSKGTGWNAEDEKTQWTPPDSTLLKLSDYYRLREEFEAAHAEVAKGGA